MASLPLMMRSFHVEPLVAPSPMKDRALEQTVGGRQYAAYLRHWCGAGSLPLRAISMSFLAWVRVYSLEASGPKRRKSGGSLAIGVRFAFEMLDLFLGPSAYWQLGLNGRTDVALTDATRTVF